MNANERRADELLDRIILEIKGMVLLERSDARLRERLRGKLVDSHDESLKRFVAAVQSGGTRESGHLLAVAVGQLVLASVLVVAGTIVLLPTISGINSPAGLIQYFAQGIYGAVGGSLLAPYLPLVEFAVGAVLMTSAFYALRQAAFNLKEAGLAIEPGKG